MRGLDLALEHGARVQRDREQGQANLFGDAVPSSPGAPDGSVPDGPPWTEMEWLANEKEALGLYLSGHPVDRHTPDLRAFGARTVGDLLGLEVPGAEDGQPGRLLLEDVAVGGVVAAVRALKTKKGDPMAVLTLEDAQGSIETVVFPETYGRFRHLIETGALLLVKGKFERDEDSTRFQANELAPLEGLRERMARSVNIHLNATASRSTLEALWDVLAQHQGDRPIVLELEVAHDTRRLRVKANVTPQIRVKPSEQLITAVERVCGAGSVVLQ
jgi:DNA polymerase-3 subunit alpha